MPAPPTPTRVRGYLVAWWPCLAPLLRAGRTRQDLGTPVERATFHTLHTASLAAPPLRAGLTRTPPARPSGTCGPCSARPAVALTDREQLLAWDGGGRPPRRRDDGHGR